MISLGSIATVATLIPKVIDAIQHAERFIRGKGRGKEKKKAVTENLVDYIKDLKDTVEKADLKTINWFNMVLAGPEIMQKIGALVDAIVDLMNFLAKFDDVEAPADPKLVN